MPRFRRDVEGARARECRKIDRWWLSWIHVWSQDENENGGWGKRVPDGGKLSEEEGMVLQRYQGKLVQHSVPYTQHHRRHHRERHLHRPLLHCPPPNPPNIHRPIQAAPARLAVTDRVRAGTSLLLPTVRPLPRRHPHRTRSRAPRRPEGDARPPIQVNAIEPHDPRRPQLRQRLSSETSRPLAGRQPAVTRRHAHAVWLLIGQSNGFVLSSGENQGAEEKVQIWQVEREGKRGVAKCPMGGIKKEGAVIGRGRVYCNKKRGKSALGLTSQRQLERLRDPPDWTTWTFVCVAESMLRKKGVFSVILRGSWVNIY